MARKREVVLRLLRAESAEHLSRELGVPLYKLAQWRQKAEAALDGALKEREADPAAGELAAALQRIGELRMEVELLRARIERPGPLARRRSRQWRRRPPRALAAAVVSRASAGPGRCRGSGQCPEPFYAARQKAAPVAPRVPTLRRGPQPAVSDEALLAAIRADLARSPWSGEGHRKVWARLRAMDGVRVSRKRVLRLMRDNALLSPHRTRTRPNTPHDRHIVTQAPNVTWATDATQITTVQDGRAWLFGAVEHWNAEMLGWHAAEYGARFEAVQAVGMALRQESGHLSAGAARGLALRHDHGSAFLAGHFQNQIRFWGISPGYAFVGEPETNGVIERFFRTFKERIVHGRIYQTIHDVRDAVRAFAARYNAEWLIEKNGLRSPNDARTAWNQATFRRADNLNLLSRKPGAVHEVASLS